MTLSPNPPADLLAGYEAGRTGAALYDESSRARLWLEGDDCIAFLQRLTTNDVQLPPGQGTVTILTSPTARILAVFTVQIHPGGVLLLAGPGQGPLVYNTLRTQIFFNDKVSVEGRGGALAQFGLYGPRAGAVLVSAGAGNIDDLPLFAWRQVIVAGVECTAQRIEGLGSAGFTLLTPSSAGQVVRHALLQAGAAPLSEEAFHVLRVEGGVPMPGVELTEDVNPLEAGLRRFCNDHKGCYTGQEVIARQITYDKVTTHLAGLLPDRPVAPQDRIEVDGRQVGWVTSAVTSVALGRPIALAFLRRPFHAPSTAVTVVSRNGPIAARVTDLPFGRQ